jgi:hypothetical protein
MQWRIALSWVSGYFVYPFFTPVLFSYHGPIVAGQMGMTWSVIAAMKAISTSWLNPRIPQFGMLVAQKRYKELDSLFWRITRIVTIVAIIISITIWGGVYLIYSYGLFLANRILPPFPTGIFLLAQVVIILTVSFSYYLRAHKKEPLLILNVMFGILIGSSTLVLGKYYSANGVALGYLVVNMVLAPFVFWIWHRCRVSWHGSE